MLLPMPLVSFEEYMLLDDRTAYPMNFFIRLRFSGRIDRVALESALRIAVGRHVLLSAQVRKSGRKRFDWVAADVPVPHVKWSTGPSTDGYPHCPGINLQTEPGLRPRVHEAEDTSDLLLQFHHGCCDGLGASKFIGDLLVTYDSVQKGTSPPAPLPPLDQSRLQRRGRFGLTAWKLLRTAHLQATGLSRVRDFFLHAPVPIIGYQPQPPDAPVPEHFPSAISESFDRADTAALRKVARRENVTVNDLLTRDLFLALSDWRTRHDVGDPRQWLRVSVPINLRTAGDHKLPAANIVSMVFIDRCPTDFHDPARLLAGLHEELQLIKHRRLGLALIFSLWMARILPGGLNRIIRDDRCLSTCVLTNLGSPLLKIKLPRRRGRLVVGNLVLESVDTLAPIRPYTCAAFALTKYAHRLFVTLHYDARTLTADSAGDLLATFMRHGRQSAGAMKRVPPHPLPEGEGTNLQKSSSD